MHENFSWFCECKGYLRKVRSRVMAINYNDVITFGREGTARNLKSRGIEFDLHSGNLPMASKRLIRAAAADGITLDPQPADAGVSADKRATRRSGAALKERFPTQEDSLATTEQSAEISDGVAISGSSPSV